MEDWAAGVAVAGVAAGAGAGAGDIPDTGSALAAGAADLDSALAGELGGIRIGRSIHIHIGTTCGGAIPMGILGRLISIRMRTSWT